MSDLNRRLDRLAERLAEGVPGVVPTAADVAEGLARVQAHRQERTGSGELPAAVQERAGHIGDKSRG